MFYMDSCTEEIQRCLTDKGNTGDAENHAETSASTILEWLNEDCWRLVLDYVAVRDIMRSERVSQRWQAVVHCYLQEAGVCLVSSPCRFGHQDVKMYSKNRILTIRLVVDHDHEEKQFLRLLDKWGPCVAYTYCPTRQAFEKIVERCANLKSIAIDIYRFGSGDLSSCQVEFVKRLERIALMDFINREILIQFELSIEDSMEFTPEDVYNGLFQYENYQNSRGFWPNFEPAKLKSLTVRGSFDFSHFLSAVGCFPELIELNLQGPLKNVHLLLQRTPILERLCLMDWSMPVEDQDGVIGRSLQSGLSRLKCLTVWHLRVSDWWLQAAMRGCNQLRSLRVCWSADTDVVGLCRMIGQTLNEVWVISDHQLQDDDATDIIASCPNLTTLDVRYCNDISDALVGKAARAARGRSSTLRLRIGRTAASSYSSEDSQNPGLIIDRELPQSESFMDIIRPLPYIDGI